MIKHPPYALFQVKDYDCVTTLYESGKAMFQGIGADIEASYHKIIVDQFTTPKSYFSYLKQENISGKVAKITFLTKGESNHLSVAAASVISRYLFLEEMDKLSQKYNTTILKGTSDKVDALGKEIVKKYGKTELNKIAKTNFKNTEKILNN